MKFGFRDIEPDFYRARLLEIRRESGRFGDYLRLVFAVSEGELRGFIFPGFIKPSTLRCGKFYRWVGNILGADPPSELSDRDLVGKECVVFISRKNGRFYSVTEVLPLSGVPDSVTEE